MRSYLVFGSNDGGKTLEPVGEYEAQDHESAKKKARSSGHKSYGTCPTGNWSFGNLSVREIVDVEEAKLPIPGQLTVDEVLDEAVAEAREALEGPVEPAEK